MIDDDHFRGFIAALNSETELSLKGRSDFIGNIQRLAARGAASHRSPERIDNPIQPGSVNHQTPSADTGWDLVSR
jgi:hypothetical protein